MEVFHYTAFSIVCCYCLEHIYISAMSFSPPDSQSCFDLNWESKKRVIRVYFAVHFMPSFALIPSFTAFLWALVFPVTEAPWKPVCVIMWFCPVFSAPRRIQWHSFLMRLLSLLISASSGKMNDSQPCNKYNMRCINFSENKNGRLLLLIPFQMFRFMAFSMSESFSNFVAEIYFHLINEQLRKRGVYSQNLHTKGHVFDESSWSSLLVCVCVHIIAREWLY